MSQLAQEQAWSAAIARRPTTPRVVALIAGKGGVGTSTTAAGLALTLGSLWAGGVALADIRTGAASLGLRLGGIAAPDAATFAAGVVEPLLAGGVTIVDGASWDTPMTRPTLARVAADLREDHLFTILDVGDDAGDVGHGAIARADRVVVVTTLSPDSLDATRRTLIRLRNIDATAADRAVVVVTGTRGLGGRSARGQPNLPPAGQTVSLPWDKALDGGIRIDLERWQRSTRAAFLRLAATLGDHVGGLG